MYVNQTDRLKKNFIILYHIFYFSFEVKKVLKIEYLGKSNQERESKESIQR